MERNIDWREMAACRDTDPDLFFPVGTTGPVIEQIENAKAVCRQCDVQVECLEYALATNQDSGNGVEPLKKSVEKYENDMLKMNASTGAYKINIQSPNE